MVGAALVDDREKHAQVTKLGLHGDWLQAVTMCYVDGVLITYSFR